MDLTTTIVVFFATYLRLTEYSTSPSKSTTILKLVRESDSHFAHISHKIVRWVRLGNDLESGEQVAELIKVTVTLLTIRRKQVRNIRIADIITEESLNFLIYRLSYSHFNHFTVQKKLQSFPTY